MLTLLGYFLPQNVNVKMTCSFNHTTLMIMISTSFESSKLDVELDMAVTLELKTFFRCLEV